ncbi:MAG TPA: prolyl oligopeptidase family serine peptidase [Candidatus Elarobacter sp.]|nr:prolyl oligopeptidase family serine peptidase [Candidatus Elarobacter sp.]
MGILRAVGAATGAVRTSVLAAAFLVVAVPVLAEPRVALVYPQAPRADVVDTYWSTPVPDPYRPLENVEAPQTQAWLRAEAALSRNYLGTLPYRDAIKAAFEGTTKSLSYETPLEQHGQFWTWSRNAPGKRTVIYVRDGALQPDRTLLDKNELPSNVAVANLNWSRSGRLMAYSTQTNGSDWLTWHVRDVATATDLPDILKWGKYSGVSFAGDEGFYYSGYDAPAPGHEYDPPAGPFKAFYHRLGTPQSADLLLRTAHLLDEWPWTGVTDDGRYAISVIGQGEKNGFEVFPAEQPGAPHRTLVEPGDGHVEYVTNVGSRFFFRSNAGAPNGRIIEVDAADPAHRARTIVPERADALIDASLLGDRLFLNYLHDVHNVLEIADAGGRRIGTIPLPGLGTATVPRGDAGDGFAYYTYESFIQPRTTCRYEMKTGRSTIAARDPVPFDSAPFVTEQIFATSKDGTRVPMFVTHRRDMPYDGSTPTMLWGYAALGLTATVTPTFWSANAVWLRMGGAYAVVNARGGGEYGEEWHRAGMLQQKQHGFDDVIAAAELLVARKITSPSKLALSGASMGGLMVGAVVVQRPDLFAAALPNAAPLDMLRFQKFVAGPSMAVETGSSEESEAMFRALYAYSPLHNVRAGRRYPAMLITTGDHDDRVFPAHSYKFAAALQQAQGGDAPVLLNVHMNAGHDFGVAGSAADGLADRYAFLVKALNFTPSL